MKFAGFWVLILMSLPIAAFACLNTFRDPPRVFSGKASGQALINHLRSVMAKKSNSPAMLEKYWPEKGAPPARRKEAQAVIKVLKGDVQGGVDMLEEVEALGEQSYSVAANLGTAYELKGDPLNALKWISIGIQRNPLDHYGTEWLHQLILDAKVEALKHPEQPLQGHLLNLPDLFEDDTLVTVDGKGRTIHDITDALYIQLSERMVFVKPKDPYVADLLYSYGMVEANTGDAWVALELLQLAREYGFADEALLKEREEQYKVLAAKDARALGKKKHSAKK